MASRPQCRTHSDCFLVSKKSFVVDTSRPHVGCCIRYGNCTDEYVFLFGNRHNASWQRCDYRIHWPHHSCCTAHSFIAQHWRTCSCSNRSRSPRWRRTRERTTRTCLHSRCLCDVGWLHRDGFSCCARRSRSCRAWHRASHWRHPHHTICST